MPSKQNLQKVFSIIFILAMVILNLNPGGVQAQSGDGLKRHINAGSGRVSFLSPENGRPLPASNALGTSIRPQDPAMALARIFGPEFGLRNPDRDLAKIKDNRSPNGQWTVRYQQKYQDIPVLGGELIVNTNNNGDFYSMSGEISPNLSLATRPTIDSAMARETALQMVAKGYESRAEEFTATEPELWIFDESLLRSSSRPVELVWRLEVSSKDISMPVRELVLVNAERGHISLHFNQVDTAWSTTIQNPNARTFTPENQPLAAPTFIKYEDLVVDAARNRLYGADKDGNKVDVISMADLSVLSSFTLTFGAAPISLDLSPNGNELAVAQSGMATVKFINLTNNSTSDTAALSDSGTKVTDVLYGRSGTLYALSNNGVHVIDLTVIPHAEAVSQYAAAEGYPYDQKFGVLSSDKNTLFFVTGTCCTGYNSLNKYNVSAGLAKPTLLKQTHLYDTGFMRGIRLSLINANSILITTGAVYNTSNLTPKAKNFQILDAAIALPGKDFYVTLNNNTSGTDTLNFFDNDNSYQLSALDTGVIGTTGAIVEANNSSTLFVSSTGGMAKFTVGVTAPGTPVSLPASQNQYNDIAIDLPRGLAYGTDISGRIDVVSLGTADVVNSFVLPSGASPIGIDLSPDGSELAIALNGLEKILFINPETGGKIAEVTPQFGVGLDENSIYYTNLPFDVIYGRAGRLYSDGNPSGGGLDYIHVINTTAHAWVSRSSGFYRTGAELALRSDKNYLYANETFSPNNIYVINVQTDAVTSLYQGPHGPVNADQFTIVPDGSKIFTSSGQVWDSIMQSQLGTLQGAPGILIKHVPTQNMVVLSAAGGSGDVLKFVNPNTYNLIGTYIPSQAGTIHEMEIAPDGSKLVMNIDDRIQVLSLNSTLPSYIAAQSGANQSSLPQTQFSQPFKAKVSNFLGTPLAGITVTFTAPSSGASGKFAGTSTTTATATTDGNGVATSPAFIANNIVGGYTVKATVEGVAGYAGFQLSNGALQSIKTYTANNSTSLPGTLLCDQNAPNCTNGTNLHADKAHLYAIGTYNLYLQKHNRNGINGSNLPILSTVHFYSGYANAFWNGAQMVYGDAYGYPLADDVVAHELTHGVTEYESNLFYYYQSGAINESFSDLWGEYYDQINGSGSDGTNDRWYLGEDVSGYGALRYMSFPTDYGDPDKITSPYYYLYEADNGGVHSNSGVNNKAVFLMVEGGFFNGKTVSPLGWDKTAAIYYQVNTNLLTSGADYSDLYYALQQACFDLMGQNGITSGDCLEVKDAVDAVEMNLQPVSNFNPDAPFCAADLTPENVFFDNLEGGTSNWSFNNGAYTRWQYDSPWGQYAHSGAHFLFADDYPAVVTDATARLKPVWIPANAYLHFAHAYDFESFGTGYHYDGGVLEYSINGGSSWVDAAPLIDTNGYNGTISNNYNNPLKGRSAFVGSSHGYVSTRLNLSSLAGQTVIFRWRMGLDSSGASWGWWLDDVRIYNRCVPFISGSTGIGGVTLSYTEGTLRTVTSQADGSYSFQVPIGWSGTVAPSHVCYTFNPGNRAYDSLASNQKNQNYTAIFNPVSGCGKLNVEFGGILHGSYVVPPGGSIRQSYLGMDNGPVKIASTNNVPIIAAMRAVWKMNGTFSSYSELMGLPAEQLSSDYYFPWYNFNAPGVLDEQFRFGNVDIQPTTVEVSVGDQSLGIFNLDPGESTRLSYPGLDNGPIRIRSLDGRKIIAAMRAVWKMNGTFSSYSELMGLPVEQLSTEYYFPWYNNATPVLDEQFRFANVDTTATQVEVQIGSQVFGPYDLDPGESMRIAYPVDDGPVYIRSLDGRKIIAAMRAVWKMNGTFSSYSELMGLPAEQLSSDYYFPWYNFNAPGVLDEQFRFGNVDIQPTTVEVSVGSTILGTYDLDPGESVRDDYPGLDNGPIHIRSLDGRKIIAAMRAVWKMNGTFSSYSELMGLPAEQLSTEYYFPWYNFNAPALLDEQLRFGMP